MFQPALRDRFRYVRISPQLSEDPPRLDEAHRMRYVQENAGESQKSVYNVEKVALQLIATSFLKNQIPWRLCRLALQSAKLYVAASSAGLPHQIITQDMFIAVYCRKGKRSAGLGSS